MGEGHSLPCTSCMCIKENILTDVYQATNFCIYGTVHMYNSDVHVQCSVARLIRAGSQPKQLAIGQSLPSYFHLSWHLPLTRNLIKNLDPVKTTFDSKEDPIQEFLRRSPSPQRRALGVDCFYTCYTINIPFRQLTYNHVHVKAGLWPL